MRATVVLGSSFGDEGKGLITDFLASAKPGATVVRFNGGAQAGHTVQVGDRRHVFHHFGSGTFAGAQTHLGSKFIVNPILFNEEWKKLNKPYISVDPACLVTTPWDMAINQAVENKRGDGRHGSCGVGINETIERSVHPFYRISFSDFNNPVMLDALLQGIEQVYVPARCAALGIRIPAFSRDQLFDECRTMKQCVKPRHFKEIIFEGAQGLLLDQHAQFFPHVTRSNTGLDNVLELMPQFGVDALDIIYVTRTYLTRHGNGPLPGEDPKMFFDDRTNQPHPFQGKLRFAPLDLGLMTQAIAKDVSKAPLGSSASIALTWCDAVRGDWAWHWGGKNFGGLRHLTQDIGAATGLPVRYQAHGPKREHVKHIGSLSDVV